MHTCDSPVRRSPPARCRAALPLDLHVLGLSLAFILSQDQTLHCMCLFCYFHCPRQGFLASRKKTCRTPVAACLSSSHPCQRTSLPLVLPPMPRDRSRPESGCKDKPIFYPNPNFSPTFLRKNQTRKHNRLENNGEQECFFSDRTRSSGRRPSDSGNKAPPPPTRASRKSSPPCWKTGTRNPWTQNHRRTTTRKPLVSTPQPANNRGRGATRPVRTRTRRAPCVSMARSAHVFVPPSRHSELMPLPHPKRAIATPRTRRVRRQAMPTKEVLPICRYLKLSIGAFPFY